MGSLIAVHIRSRYLEIFLGLFLIIIAIRFYFPLEKSITKTFLPIWIGSLMGVITGFFVGCWDWRKYFFNSLFHLFFTPMQQASGTSISLLTCPSYFRNAYVCHNRMAYAVCYFWCNGAFFIGLLFWELCYLVHLVPN